MCLVAQSCPTLCDPMHCNPPGSSVLGDSPGKNALLQGTSPSQGLNPGLLHCRQILLFFLFFLSLFIYLFFFNFKILNSYMRSQTWTPLPPPSPQHLSGSSPCTCPKQAAPYVRHGLAIQFLHDSIHVRIPILPNRPTLSLSLWVQKSIIHICVFFPVLHTGSSLPSS